MTDETRTETDSLGTIDIPADRLWGPQTERARRLFRIGSERFPPGLIRAVGLQKQAAAEANRELGELPDEIAVPIIAAAARWRRTGTMRSSRCRSGRPAPARRPT
jgi:fumarate hydratase class II